MEQSKEELRKKQAEEISRLIEAGKKLGLIYRFDAITVMKKYAAEMKSQGSNGKSKGANVCVDLISHLPSVDAVRVTRCERCKNYKEGICERFDWPMNADDYCSRPSKRTVGEPEQPKEGEQI